MHWYRSSAPRVRELVTGLARHLSATRVVGAILLLAAILKLLAWERFVESLELSPVSLIGDHPVVWAALVLITEMTIGLGLALAPPTPIAGLTGLIVALAYGLGRSAHIAGRCVCFGPGSDRFATVALSAIVALSVWSILRFWRPRRRVMRAQWIPLVLSMAMALTVGWSVVHLDADRTPAFRLEMVDLSRREETTTVVLDLVNITGTEFRNVNTTVSCDRCMRLVGPAFFDTVPAGESVRVAIAIDETRREGQSLAVVVSYVRAGKRVTTWLDDLEDLLKSA